MNSIIERIKQHRLWDFPGGVFPREEKRLSNQFEISEVSLPSVFYIPLKQHIGVEGGLQVAVGDKVLKGQPLTHSSNPFAVPVHAPTSGEITAIKEHVSAQPSGQPELTIELTPDGLEKWTDLSPVQQYKELPKAEVVEKICQAGISGMGGAGFPTHIKLSTEKKVKYLIINGVECEPYITSDDRLMREHSWQIRQGIDVLVHLLEPECVFIAIENNKPEAIQAMQVACQEEEKYIICEVPTKYPAGGEKQLIQVLTGQEIPKGKLPVDLGIMMQNVGTCFAVADAIFAGKPLVQRVVTLTGRALEQPKNVWALLGTPVEHLLNEAGYSPKKQKQQRIVMGGPMMGFTIASPLVPVVKITNCLLAPTEKEMPTPGQEMACIRCGACADACPAGLLPQQLYWHAKAGELDKLQEFNLFDCIECGACAFVCPSNIPLVHYYRQSKADVRINEEQKQKSDKSKARFNARKDRLEREKEERELKRQQSAQAREKLVETEKQKQAEIVASASEAKVEAQIAAKAEDKNSKVAAAIARAKAKREAAQNDSTSETPAKVEEAPADTPNAEEDDKKAKIAAAIARAKAKREAAQNDSTSETPAKVEEAPADTANAEENDKKAKIAAAIARAKAKREAAQAQIQEPAQAQIQEPVQQEVQSEPSSSPSSETLLTLPASPQQDEDPEEARRKRVEAAIAKAKARKAERENEQAKSDKPNSGEQ
ncbi:electron transport complex subunit RsxC [Paraneptunicella aestuarii]|uniref:electron transport complex subunit RsxC n=1 Tax=Paraneptunicella aestuarii TaxID=2831148 RepID=UPI001E55F6F9|nr:electron transport complex subunit RsxC [Paraneptunicella aestuarii]UAA37875.1 electron transport complex subunit RsxC [Paraneptunicella aestuarii]